MQSVYWWITIGILFLLIEISFPGLFFFISFTIGCIAGAIGAFFKINTILQYLVALTTTLITFGILSSIFANKTNQKHISNIDALIGQTGIVTQTIEPHIAGRIKINGEEWVAITAKSTHLEKNTLVTILAIEGNKLIVKNI